jgi:WD40 repeat protein
MAFRSLDADDVFLSYSRQDGETYLNGLADALTKRGFSCFDDRGGTDAGRLLPKTLFRKIKNCQTLVLLATPAAIAESEFIAQEVAEFARANGTRRIVGISFDAGDATLDEWSAARWIEWVDGKSRSRERRDALETGVPSVGVVSRIEKQSDYQKSKERLLRIRNRSIAVAATLVVLAGAAGAYARYSVREAAEAKKQTQTAQAIAEAGALAAQSENVLLQRPQEVQRSLELARRALDLSSSAGFHSAETDTAIRQSLAQFPYLRERDPIAKGEKAVSAIQDVALSPDGRHFAVLDRDGKLQVGDTFTKAAVTTLECDCSRVALSSGALFAAAVTGRGVDVLSLKGGRPKPIAAGVEEVVKIAMSPGGRYLAIVGSMKVDDVPVQVLSVVDAVRGVVRRFSTTTPLLGADTLPARIDDVAFGPTGDLAVGGTFDDAIEDAGRRHFSGSVVIWHLRLNSKGLATERAFAERDLTAADFARVEVIRQRGSVGAVAPGSEETFFATSEGVWMRRRGEREFSVVARPAYTLEPPRTAIVTRVAFALDGHSLVLVKEIEGAQNDQSNDEIVVEKWDAAGYRDTAATIPRTDTVALSARPGGEAIAVVSPALDAGGSAAAFGVRGDARLPPLIVPSKSALAETKARALSSSADILIHANDVVAVLWDIWAATTRTVDLAGALHDVTVATVSPGGKFLAIYGRNSEEKRAIAVYSTQGGAGLSPRIILQHDVHEMAGPADASEEKFVLSKMLLSADGRRLAVSYTHADNFVRVWNLTEGIDITPYCLQGLVTTNRERGCQVSNTESVALSFDGGLLAVSDAGVTQLFDLSKDREAPPLTVLTKVSVASLAFSPDRRYFGVGSYEGLLYVLDSQFGWAQAARLAHDGAIRAVTFTGDGSHVATVSDVLNPGDPNHSLRIWLLQSDRLLAEASARLDALHKPSSSSIISR